MKFALWPLSMNVVSAKAASPRGAGSATGRAAAGVARVSSTTAIRASFCRCFASRRSHRDGMSRRRPGYPNGLRIKPLAKETRLGLQIVRILGQQLGPVLGHEHEILEPAAAVAVAIQAGLDRDHVALDELPGVAAQPGLLVHFQADAVAQAVEEPVLEDLAVALGQARRVGRLVEELAREHVDVAARDARLHRLDRSLERFVNVLVVGGELLGRLADHERARHVGVAGRLSVARPEVEHDRLVRLDLPGTHLVADRGLGAMGDDELVAEEVQVGEGLLDRHLDALAGEGLAVEEQPAVLFFGAAEKLTRGVHAGLGTPLRAPDPLHLGVALDATPLHEGLAIRGDLDPLRPEAVRKLEREGRRDDGLPNAELLDGPDDRSELDLLHRDPLPDEVVPAELLDGVRLQPVVPLDALDFERRDHDVTLAIALEVEERIGDDDGHLVAHLRGAEGVGPDQDVSHGAGCYLRLQARRRLRPHGRGARGIKLHPRAQRFLLNDERLAPVFELAAERRVPILIHGGRGLPPIASELAALVDRYPEAQLIIAHGGIADLPALAERFAGKAGVFFDTSVWSPIDLLTVFRVFSPEQVVYASDFPYGQQPSSLLIALRTARVSGLDEDDVRNMLAGIANRIADGEPPLEPTKPKGGETFSQPMALARIHQYLSMATPLLWTRQPDTVGVIGLALHACYDRDGHADERERIRELLAAARDVWRLLPEVDEPDQRIISRTTFRLIHLADILAVTPSSNG